MQRVGFETMIGYIYKVTNKVNGKIYIGQTIQSVKDRWYRHCAKKNLSKAEMNMHIKRAILKYGKKNFTVETLEECDSSLLNERERYYISYFDSYRNGYNSTEGGQDGAKPLQTPENIQKIIVELYTSGFSLRTIGKEYDIDKTTVKGILTAHNIPLRATRTYKLSQADREEIVTKINTGISRKQIMEEYHIGKSYLSQLITGHRRI